MGLGHSLWANVTWHAGGMLTPDDIRAAKAEYEESIAAAGRKRAAVIAQAAAEGMPQKEIIEATGYSRETIRRLTREGAADAPSGPV